MKTFLSILGGLLTVTAVAAVLLLIGMFPWAVGGAVVVACALAVIAILFHLGYTFVRDVILG